MDTRQPSGWLAAVLFPVVQKGKGRACDDYTRFGNNATAGSCETVDTEGPDFVIAVAKLWTSSVTLSDGTELRGTLHESLELRDLLVVLARLVDLARAYKQLARRSEEANLAIFALQNEEGIWELYEAIALGFGSRDAVFSFKLASRALRHIPGVLLWTAATQFYDDFSQVNAEPLAVNSWESTEKLFRPLGWDFKHDEGQLLPTATSFSPLVVTIDFSELGFATIGNTVKRKERIVDEIARLQSLAAIPPSSMLSLIGV